MWVRPPALQVFVAKHPWLAGPIGDGAAGLRHPVALAGIEPVEAFAAGNVRLQIGSVVDRRPCLRVEVIPSVAPVGERHVIVDTDEIDVRIRPERVEVEEHVAAAVLRMVPEIFRPVGRIADLRSRPEDRAHGGGERLQGSDSRIGRSPRSDLGQPAHFRSDQEGVDAARDRAEVGVMQDHAPEAPIAHRAGPGHAVAAHREVLGLGIAEEGGDLRGGCAHLVHGSCESCGGRAGDPAAPGQHRLTDGGGIIAIRVRQRVVGRHVHHQERIEGDAQTARLHVADRLHHGKIRRGAAIDRAAPIVPADNRGLRSRDAVDAPFRGGVLLRQFDLGPDGAVPGAQIIPEP